MKHQKILDTPAPKTIEENFRDWEASTFGFGYGTGEHHIIPALKRFFELVPNEPENRSYDYKELERELTPTVAWLLINILNHHKVEAFDYGVSPRYAWLTARGVALKTFMGARSIDALVEIVTDYSEDYATCMPDVCNCGPTGYVKGAVCPNPFWQPLR